MSDILLFLLGNVNKYFTFSFARSNETHCGYSNLTFGPGHGHLNIST